MPHSPALSCTRSVSAPPLPPPLTLQTSRTRRGISLETCEEGDIFGILGRGEMRRLARGVTETLPPPPTRCRGALPYKEGNNTKKKPKDLPSNSEGGSRPRCYLCSTRAPLSTPFACSVEGYCKAAASGHEVNPGFVYKWAAARSIECERYTPLIFTPTLTMTTTTPCPTRLGCHAV